jgi:putative hydrolase of the HAD superfamily
MAPGCRSGTVASAPRSSGAPFSLEFQQLRPRCYVFFDVDDTLIEWTVSPVDAYVQAAKEVGVSVAPERVLGAVDTAWSTSFYADLVREHADRADERAFWLAYDGRLLETMGVERGLTRATERVVELLTRPGSRRLYAEAPEVLRTLSASGVRLGIITGRPCAGPELEALGVRHYFHLVIDAFAARSAKPEGRMFHMAAEAAEATRLPAWHVGDSYDDDVVGARAAGLRPILLDRTGVHTQADCPRVRDLREIVDIVVGAPQ